MLEQKMLVIQLQQQGFQKAIYNIYFVLVILLDSITDSITSINGNTITK